jgi:MEMO1 family protein
MLRHPAVAGRFYNSMAGELRNQVRGFLISGEQKTKALGILSPHAGLVYSGPVAGEVYSRVELPRIFVLIGPNHTGFGSPIALMAKGAWETPLGTVNIDEELAASILSRSPLITEDHQAHLHEHSLEVQLPFIQYLRPDAVIVPIQMLDNRLTTCLQVGSAVGHAIRERRGDEGGNGSEDVVIVASSDMSHYEMAEIAREKDYEAIRDIIALDPEGLYRTVKKLGITMCGYGPVVSMIAACKILGAGKAELICYANSGEVSGDNEQVVGYAGVVVR